MATEPSTGPEPETGIPRIIPPGFKGEYYVEFMDGSMRLLCLIGATIDTDGRPIFLYDAENNVFNFNNVLSVRRRARA